MFNKGILFGFGILIFDQVSKFLVLRFFPNLVLLNQNGSWGVLPWWTSIIGIVFLGFYIFYKKYYNFLIFVILFAGLSNLFDRVLYNGVVDFIKIGNFPVFNFADVFISLGVVMLIYKESKIENK